MEQTNQPTAKKTWHTPTLKPFKFIDTRSADVAGVESGIDTSRTASS